MFYKFKAGIIVSLLCILSACQSAPQTQQILAAKNSIAPKHEIMNVPFYPQEAFYCGPTTLAEVFNFHGADTSPQAIAPNLFVPELEGSLQLEMVSASRQQGLLSYAQKGNLPQLLGLIRDDIPVVVLQNVSIAWLPMWHYALVIGYDLQREEIILHTGETERHTLNFATFERTWARGDYWLLAAVPPEKMSKQFTPLDYTQAAQDLLSTGQKEAGRVALQTAIKSWPDYWLSYFLIGNDYLVDDPQQAAFWYQKGYQHAQEKVPYLNNYAYTLATLGCDTQAQTLMVKALAHQPNDVNLLDTQAQISALADGSATAQLPAATQCPLIR